MIKILFFSLDAVGGAERVTMTISRMLPNSNYSVEYVLVGRGNNQISNFAVPGVKIYTIKTKHIYGTLLFKIIRIIRKVRPNYVFAASPAINVRLIISAFLFRNLKVIVRSSTMLLNERCDIRFLVRKTYPYAYKVVVQQEEMKEELLAYIPRMSKEKVALIHNPIDEEVIKKGISAPSPYVSCKHPRYLCVGRFSREKAQDVLAKAFVILKKRIPSAELYYVGRYSQDNSVYINTKAIVSEGAVSNSVFFVGYDPNPYRWIYNADCVVLPSVWEGLPNVLIEAMYLNKTVVSTLCVPIVERIVENGNNGYVVSINNPDEMAIAMEKAIGLKFVHNNYKPGTSEEFISLFQ